MYNDKSSSKFGSIHGPGGSVVDVDIVGALCENTVEVDNNDIAIDSNNFSLTAMIQMFNTDSNFE